MTTEQEVLAQWICEDIVAGYVAWAYACAALAKQDYKGGAAELVEMTRCWKAAAMNAAKLKGRP